MFEIYVKWGSCSLECNDGEIGQRSRSRECEGLIRENPEDRICDGELEETQNCNNFPCLRLDVNSEPQCIPMNEEVKCGKNNGVIERRRECTPDEIDEGECFQGSE